jgi:tRNA dimethylallyltransferase
MIVVIVGPTAVGKSTLAVALAKRLNAEIISGDSVQIYKELTIGSAKPTSHEQGGIVHHLIDEYEIGQPYSVADFQRQVRAKMDDILARQKAVIVCGGTGIYVNAALYDYVFDSTNRDIAYEATLATRSNEELHELLKHVDPKTAIKFHPNNRVRVLRALGYHHSTDQLISAQSNKDQPLYSFIGIGLTMERALLYERINERVDAMLQAGLLEEIHSLVEKQDQIQAIGYNELFEYVANKLSYEEAVSLIKQRSRQLAKRQFTWFTNQMQLQWIDVTAATLDDVTNQAMKLIASATPNQ